MAHEDVRWGGRACLAPCDDLGSAFDFGEFERRRYEETLLAAGGFDFVQSAAHRIRVGRVDRVGDGPRDGLSLDFHVVEDVVLELAVGIPGRE